MFMMLLPLRSALSWRPASFGEQNSFHVGGQAQLTRLLEGFVTHRPLRKLARFGKRLVGATGPIMCIRRRRSTALHDLIHCYFGGASQLSIQRDISGFVGSD